MSFLYFYLFYFVKLLNSVSRAFCINIVFILIYLFTCSKIKLGFVKADSSTLPRVDALMVAHYFKNNEDFFSAEVRNVKTSMSSRQTYGDEAIGYVQIKKENGICTLKCRISPEHKVRSKSYSVTMTVDEKSNVITSVKCEGCAASEGGCKHSVAFLMWTHRRSEEPSSTSKECYWRKPNLSKVGSSLKFITTKELSSRKKNYERALTQPDVVLTAFLLEAKKQKLSCQLLRHQVDYEFSNPMKLSFHNLILDFYKSDEGSEWQQFLSFVSKKIGAEEYLLAEEQTRTQHKSSLWYELRYGRITASKAHEISRCKKMAGSLVETIMGARIPDTIAMKRGRTLEAAVRIAVEKTLKKKVLVRGILISKEHPMLAASPDGVCEDFCVEIKCPTSLKTQEYYVKDGNLTPKFLAQVHVQMFVTQLRKCCFCVASPDFEINKTVEIQWVNFNEMYFETLLENLKTFWINVIYPLLYKSIDYKNK